MSKSSQIEDLPEEFDSEILLNSKLYEDVTSRRFFAFIMDLIIIAFIYMLVALFVNFARNDYFGAASFPTLSLSFATTLGYYAFTLGGEKSASWGMRATGLSLRLYDGEKLGRVGAVLHILIFYIAMAAVWHISWIVAIFSRHNRPLHDIVGGTYLVRTEYLAT